METQYNNLSTMTARQYKQNTNTEESFCSNGDTIQPTSDTEYSTVMGTQ